MCAQAVSGATAGHFGLYVFDFAMGSISLSVTRPGASGFRAMQHGHPYQNLPTAFLYETKYVADCTCRGNPWDEAALARHRTYAEDARKKLAGKTADLASPEGHPRGRLQSARHE
jgi:Protein of unknown function (DUF2865)